VAAIDALEVGLLVKSLGAGRDRKTDPIDLSVGLVLQKKVGDPVQAGETLATVHARSQDQAAAVLPRLRAAFTISPDARSRPLLLRRVTASGTQALAEHKPA
jgi:pyrimidine-nucleoside phosphorylase